MEQKDIFKLLDLLFSEYGWGFEEGVEFLFRTPNDVVKELTNALWIRKQENLRLQTMFTAAAVSAGFSGKKGMKSLENMFTNKDAEPASKEAYINQVRTLWSKMGRDPNKLEEMIKQGNIRI